MDNKRTYRLAIVTSHPIQYNAPLFKLLASHPGMILHVFYTWHQSKDGEKYDHEFGKNIRWDLPLLEGYEYSFVDNISPSPGIQHFRGLVNPTLNKEIEQWQPDAVLVYGWNFSSHLHCLEYFHKKIPVLFRGDSTLLDERAGFRKILRRLFLTWVYRHVDYALYTGTNNRQYFLAHGLKDRQLVYAPHAVDNERFMQPDAGYRQMADDWRRELGIPADSLVVLFSGKLTKKKNPLFLIEIQKKLSRTDIHFVFVGNGLLEEELRTAAKGEDNITFIGFQNQNKMPVVYRLADIFILPSIGPGETWGLAANEAMASGCAVMLSDKVGGAIDLVREGKNGIVFKKGDLGKCCSFIESVADNRKELQAMKETSLNMIRAFSYTAIITAIENLMKRQKDSV